MKLSSCCGASMDWKICTDTWICNKCGKPCTEQSEPADWEDKHYRHLEALLNDFKNKRKSFTDVIDEDRDFIKYQIKLAEKRTEEKWQKILNSGKTMYSIGREDEKDLIKRKIGMLRQWLNEDRSTGKKLVTDEEIKEFLIF